MVGIVDEHSAVSRLVLDSCCFGVIRLLAKVVKLTEAILDEPEACHLRMLTTKLGGFGNEGLE